MELSIHKSTQLKSIAILMMLFLHLFNNTGYLTGNFTALFYVGSMPIVYYLSLFSDACVPIFAFVSGYGLYYKFVHNRVTYIADNHKRLKKLYINYWIILIVFAVFLGIILDKDGYPGSISTFLQNFSGLNPTYNGAWWFFTVYVLFVLSSTFWFRMLNRFDSYILILGLLLIYFITFYFRFVKDEVYQENFLQWLSHFLVLYGFTLLQFMLGAIALKERWISKFSKMVVGMKYKNILATIGIIGLIILHAIIPNLIIAPITALGFIFLFSQINFHKIIENTLDALGPHSTNMWLTHMFFYSVFFPVFIYSPNYVILIFGLLILCCVLSSIVINYINRFILLRLKL